MESNGDLIGETGQKMSAVVSGSRARSTWLTGAAGLLMLAAAVVMMVMAAPKVHAVRHESVTGDRLASWVWVTPAGNGEFTRAGRAPAPNVP